MADVRLSWELDEGRLLSGLDRIQDRLDLIENNLDDVQRANRDAFRSGQQDIRKFDTNLRRTQTGLKSTTASLGRLAAVAGTALGALAIGSQVRDATRLAAQYEQLRVSFTTFLGSAERANQVLEQLNEFSLATPFTPDQVNNAARALLAFGVEADELEPSLKAIGDISAGVGKDFNELATIFGKAKTQGRLFAEDINQLTEAGIPIIQEFADQFGITNEEVKELASEGGITFDNLEQAFVDLTGEGGRFFNLMEEQSQTLTGRLSTLQGNFDNLKRELGEALIPVLTDVVSALSDFVSALNSEDVIEFFEPIADDLIPALESLYNTSVEITNALFGYNSEQEQAAATAQILADGFELLVSGISAVVNLLGLAGRAIGDFVQENRLLNASVQAVGDALGFLFDKLQDLFDFINNTAEEDRLQRKLEAQKVKFDEASAAAEQNIAWMTQKAEAEKAAAAETDNQAQAQGRANVQSKAAAKDLEKLRKEYEKLTGTLSSDVEGARLSQLTGIDRLSAERDIAIREINAFADEIRETAAKAGRDLPDSFTEDVQALVDTVESEFRAGVEEIRSKDGLSPFDPLKNDLEETDFEQLGQDAVERVGQGLQQGTEQQQNILDRISTTIREALGLNPADFQFLQGQAASIFDNLAAGIQEGTQARIAQQDQLLSKIDERIQATEEALNRELGLQEEGFANNVDIEKERLETLQAEREKQAEKRLEFEKKAANQRLAIEAVQQASSLATGAARVIAAESNKGLLGVALAIAAIASFFRIFQQAKAQAAQSSTATELRGGGLFDGPGVLTHEEQRKTGRVHRIGNSRFAIEKGEWIIGTDKSKKHGAFLSELNAGRYDHLDLSETVAFASSMYRRGRNVRAGEDARQVREMVRKASGFDRLAKELRTVKRAVEGVQEEVKRRPVIIPQGKAQIITDDGRKREVRTVEVR